MKTYQTMLVLIFVSVFLHQPSVAPFPSPHEWALFIPISVCQRWAIAVAEPVMPHYWAVFKFLMLINRLGLSLSRLGLWDIISADLHLHYSRCTIYYTFLLPASSFLYDSCVFLLMLRFQQLSFLPGPRISWAPLPQQIPVVEGGKDRTWVVKRNLCYFFMFFFSV